MKGRLRLRMKWLALLAVACLIAPAAQALTAAEVWDTVEANTATMTSLQANLTSTGTFINTTTSTAEAQATSTGTLATKNYASVPGGLVRRMQTSTSLNMNHNIYRGTDGKTYLELPSSSQVKRRDMAMGASNETADMATATYVGTDTIDGTTVHVIEADYGTGNTTLTHTRFYIDTTKGVILKRECFNGTALKSSYAVDPDDVTQIGTSYVATKSTRTRYDGTEGFVSTIEDTLSSITLNGTIADSAFNYTVPTGYAVEDLD